jgi:hypothetical protein
MPYLSNKSSSAGIKSSSISSSRVGKISYPAFEKKIAKDLGYSSPYNHVGSIVVPIVATNEYYSASQSNMDARINASWQAVHNAVSDKLKNIRQLCINFRDSHSQDIKLQFKMYLQQEIENLGNYYLSQAKSNPCAYENTRSDWKAKGEEFLAFSVYDMMRYNGTLKHDVITDEEEDMIKKLQNSLAVAQQQLNQANQIIVQKDGDIQKSYQEIAEMKSIILSKEQIIEEQAKIIDDKAINIANHNQNIKNKNVNIAQPVTGLTFIPDAMQIIAQKDQIIIDKDNLISTLSNQKDGLYNQVSQGEHKISCLNNEVLTKTKEVEDMKYQLEEKKNDVTDLKNFLSDLKEQNTELRYDKKMLIEDKKIWMEEKTIILQEKKIINELYEDQRAEFLHLKHIHFETEHCNIVGHNDIHDDYILL